MTRYFVFVNMDYYPYVDEPIEADTLEDARKQAAARLRPGDGTTIYLTPADAVEAVEVSGPMPKPRGMLALMMENNRYMADHIEAKNLHGWYSVIIEPGSL